ncbi:hypothetical protein HNP47_001069 [Brevundimonas vesicularis]|uniref:Uncharacterized protein n=1 Tax=Brevundimonas vesicularis TaxID=41276 RepID=A0A7W9L584_BREVE|nr:hypothetical protein [Brevundimonas vesicularis]
MTITLRLTIADPVAGVAYSLQARRTCRSSRASPPKA